MQGPQHVREAAGFSGTFQITIAIVSLWPNADSPAKLRRRLTTFTLASNGRAAGDAGTDRDRPWAGVERMGSIQESPKSCANQVRSARTIPARPEIGEDGSE
jgi:hypothetical protein